MIRTVTTIIIGVAGFVIVRVIAGFFNLEPKSLKVGSLLGKLPTGILRSAALIVAATAAILFTILWIAFHADERIRSWFDDRPTLASLPIEGDCTLRMEAFPIAGLASKVDLVVKLKNTNQKLIKYDAELRATVNGKDLDQPIFFNAYVGANDTTNLIATLRDVPLKFTGTGQMSIDGKLRYDLKYYFNGSTKTRRTSKLVAWEATAALTEQNGQTHQIQMFTKFFDEVEE